MKTKPQKTSDVISNIITQCQSEGHYTIGEFMQMLGDRAFYIAILIFSLPNSLPIPGIPGFSTITGLPITFIAFQLMIGRDSIWFPKSINSKSFKKQTLAMLLSKALPAVIWIEKFLRPRWVILTDGKPERVIGLLFAVLSLIIALPIPGGNFLPGLAMSLVALSMLEKDGLAVSLAFAFALTSIVVMYEVISTFFGWLFAVLSNLF